MIKRIFNCYKFSYFSPVKSFLVLLTFCFALQSFTQSDSLKKNRVGWVAGTNALIGGGSVLLLNEIWYKDYPRSNLHFFNDGATWLQMDKVGHAYTAYQLCRAEHAAWRWAGMTNKNSALLSAGIVWSYQFSVEMLDGFSQEWGFSVPDLAANTAGIALFLSQQLWGFEKNQHVYLKYGYKNSGYAELRPNTLGATFPERLLKDYNAQSYWLSFSPRLIINQKPWPAWLQLSIGYSADAKLKGDEDYYTVNGFTYHAQREWALSLDIDWSKLPVRKPWLRKSLGVLNAVKLPFPSVYWRGGVCYVGMF